MTSTLEPLRRIAAYALCRPSAGEVLLVRASSQAATPGVWSLPGGAVMHGEDPGVTVVRETAAETGLSVAVGRLIEIRSDLRAVPHRGVAIHTDRLVYQVGLRGGALIARVGQPTDEVRFVSLVDLAGLPLRPFTAAALGVPPATADLQPTEPAALPSFHAKPGPDGLHQAQRFAAYGVVEDPRGRVLLTRVAAGYPGAGRWHLPGGGTDFGEQPDAAVIRELAEETGQQGRLIELLGVASHRDAAQLGPEGYPIDWHGVRAFYRIAVAAPRPPRVVEVGGSTGRARWFTAHQVPRLPLTEITAEALRRCGMAVP